MDNAQLLEKVQGTLKALQTDDIGSSILAREKRDEFIRTVTKSTPILDDARQITMNSHTHDIDRVGFASRILRGASEGVDPDTKEKPDTNTNTLESKEVIAIAGLTDSTLEDNIEEEGFENTLLDLIADRAGIDLEELFIAGERDADDSLLSVTDGWLEKAANNLSASGDSPDFDDDDVESMFDEMLRAIDKKYLRNRGEWRLYVHWDIEDAYRNLLRNRGTGLGDAAQTGSDSLAYKGIEIVDAQNMPAGKALLVPSNNLVYGLYRDIRVEPDRIPKRRITDFVTTMRVDCHFEDENAAVVAEGFEEQSYDND